MQLVAFPLEQYCCTFHHIDVLAFFLFTFVQLNWEEKCISILIQMA